MISFSVPGQTTLKPLYLRLDPTSVNWNYNMNYNIVDTYGGQVVQILSINFDKLILEGRFGREGPWGIELVDGSWKPRPHHTHDPISGTKKKYAGEAYDYNVFKGGATEANMLKIGISQMTEWFRQYFNMASQGYDSVSSAHYLQNPILLKYGSVGIGEYIFPDQALAGTSTIRERNWTVYPTDFPSFSRANEEYAPQWQITFEVEEADYNIQYDQTMKAMERIKAGVGYTPLNPFVYAAAATISKNVEEDLTKIRSVSNTRWNQISNQYETNVDSVAQDFLNVIGNTDPQTLAEMIVSGASIPNLFSKKVPGLSDTSNNQNDGVRTNTHHRPKRKKRAPGISPGTNP